MDGEILKERHQRIDPPVDGVLFCYSQWQDKYDALKREVPTAQFHNWKYQHRKR